jgi:IclR family pca regulon transcriptional regulator
MKRNAEEEAARRDDPDVIESLDRGLRALRAFGAERRPMTLSDVAKVADVPRATARRILSTLERAGYVESDGRLFALTPNVLTFASAFLASNQIVTVLQPLMDRASSEAREVCSLAILDGLDVVFIARASPARVFAAGVEIGYRLPAFCTSVGRVLLGRLTSAELAEALKDLVPIAMTAHTSLDKDVILAHVVTDRERGYSLVDQEAEEGFRSLSVPIRRYDGAVVAAINIGAHVDRISIGDMLDRFLPILRTTAQSAKDMLL